MDRLIVLLNELEGSDTKPRKFLKPRHHSAVCEIVSLLDLLCIDEEGRARIDVIAEIGVHGYEVYPLERDSFGWLVGAIVTKKGDITFG